MLDLFVQRRKMYIEENEMYENRISDIAWY